MVDSSLCKSISVIAWITLCTTTLSFWKVINYGLSIKITISLELYNREFIPESSAWMEFDGDLIQVREVELDNL